MKSVTMLKKAQEKVICSTRWFTELDVIELVQSQVTDKSVTTMWKNAHEIFSVTYLSEERYPSYAFDELNDYRPFSGLKPIIELFSEKKDSWALAYWFFGANGFLGGTRPQELLQAEPAAFWLRLGTNWKVSLMARILMKYSGSKLAWRRSTIWSGSRCRKRITDYKTNL
ncbi:MAG: hypothetical protein EOO53_11975 [Gammaproteobacteria bacterium]|nr:MAG: hypothetical protein EOO53_11975 [Gammaproteobacteria bacterium]